jgi:hypothetical protein
VFVPFNISLIEEALLIVTNPNIVFLLLTISVSKLAYKMFLISSLSLCLGDLCSNRTR